MRSGAVQAVIADGSAADALARALVDPSFGTRLRPPDRRARAVSGRRCPQHRGDHERHLDPHPVLGLVEHDAGRAVEDLG